MKVWNYASSAPLATHKELGLLASKGYTHILHGNTNLYAIKRLAGGEEGYRLVEVDVDKAPFVAGIQYKREAPSDNPLDLPVHPFYLIHTDGYGIGRRTDFQQAVELAQSQSKFKGNESIICAPFMQIWAKPVEFTQIRL